MLLLNILDGRIMLKIALKNYECKNIRGFPYGYLVSLSCAWECYFGCMCEMAGASLPAPVNNLFPSCGERTFAKRKEIKRGLHHCKG